MEDILELKTRLDNCMKKSYRPKYLHPKTINNFIFHFNSLRYKEKEFTFLHLNNYLHEVEEMHTITRNESADLFTAYLLPVAKIYDRDLGFTPMINIFLIILWFIAIGILLILLNLPTIVFYLLALLLLTYYAYAVFKKMQKKVYGLMF